MQHCTCLRGLHCLLDVICATKRQPCVRARMCLCVCVLAARICHVFVVHGNCLLNKSLRKLWRLHLLLLLPRRCRATNTTQTSTVSRPVGKTFSYLNTNKQTNKQTDKQTGICARKLHTLTFITQPQLVSVLWHIHTHKHWPLAKGTQPSLSYLFA